MLNTCFLSSFIKFRSPVAEEESVSDNQRPGLPSVWNDRSQKHKKNLTEIKMTSSRPLVFISRSLPPAGMRLLEAECDVRVWPEDSNITREGMLQGVVGVDAIICHPPDKVDTEVLNAAGDKVKVIGTMSVGLDHLDLKEIKRRGIKVGYTPNVLTDATAETTMALLLATSRRLPEGFSAVHEGGWGTWAGGMYICGKEITGSTVGIVGLGRIGLAVAKRMQPFGVSKFLYCGNTEKPWASEVNAEFVPFSTLLQQSDFVIACCSINEGNKGLFNKEAFRHMKPSAIFVNTSRGVLVNQDDLYQALRSGQIMAAGLDVTTPEPLPKDAPLKMLKNCVILPHLGSATTKARNLMSELTAKNVLAGLKGDSLPSPVPM